MSPKERLIQMIKEASTILVINFPDSSAKRYAEDNLYNALAYINDLDDK